MPETFLLTAFRFEVKLLRSPTVIAGRQQPAGAGQGYSPPQGAAELGNGAFQECGGLEIEMDIQEYQEGGRNNGTVRRVGRGKYQPVVLKRGMFFSKSGEGNAEPELWLWIQRILDGQRPVPRYDGIVHVMGQDNTLRATWMFDRGLPAKIRGPELNARTGEIAIEELTIAHEGLRLLPPGGQG